MLFLLGDHVISIGIILEAETWRKLCLSSLPKISFDGENVQKNYHFLFFLLHFSSLCICRENSAQYNHRRKESFKVFCNILVIFLFDSREH